MSRRQQRARHARRKQANARVRALGVAGGIAVAGLVPAAAAQADQTFQVTTSADTGAGSLRQAMLDANAAGGSDTITFAAGLDIIQPATDLPTLGTDLTIAGPGARSLTLDAEHLASAGAQPMFVAGDHNLTISGLTIENDSYGAVSENGASGSLRLDSDQITGNNAATSPVGGVEVANGSLTVTDSSIDTNTGGSAGGILAEGASSVTVEDSTLSGDVSKGSGGGVNLQNTGTTTIADSTIANDSVAPGDNGGGIEVGATTALTLENSILDLNAGATRPDLALVSGATANVKFSLIRTTSDVTTQTDVVADAETTALAGQDPGIVNVANNGGQTDTLLPPAGSPVINAGKEFVAQTIDQRGTLRTVGTPADGGDGTDIGAVERQPVPTVTGVSPSSGSAGDTVTITGTNSGAVEQVKFGSVNAQSFTVVNPTTITAVVPVLSTLPSTVDVTVVQAEGMSTASTADHFSGAAGVHSYNVTNLSDSGSGTLRDAIEQASAHPGHDMITFASGLSGSIPLTSDLPKITTELNIQGPGARQLAIDGTAITTLNQPMLYDADGSGALTVSGLTLEHGLDGAVANSGAALTLDSVAVTGNGQVPTSDNSTHNRIDAVYDGYSTLTIEDSTVTGNTGYLGGAIDSFAGTLNVRDSTISNNQEGSAGVEAFSNSTVNESVNISDSTITGNSGGKEAGGVYLYSGTLALNDSVVTGNTATGPALASPDVFFQHGTYASTTGTANFSLIGQMTAEPGFNPDTQSQALAGKNPLLGPLQNNGGPTDTELPQSGSPLIDAGQAFGQTTDQRGLPRPKRVLFAALPPNGDGSDIGAAELQPPPVITTTTTTKTTTPPPPRPIITGLSPHSGSSGESVKVLGSHLTGASTVKFGTVKATFHVQSDGVVVATVPKGKGRADVTVTGPGGTSATGAADRFSYLVATVGHHNPSAKWKGSHVVVDTGLFAICPKGGDRCSVSVKATSTVPASLARVRKAKTKSLTLGSASFHVSAGKRGEVTFTLTRKGLKALQKLGKLKITVTVTVVDGSVTTKQSRTITVHLPKKPKAKPKKK